MTVQLGLQQSPRHAEKGLAHTLLRWDRDSSTKQIFHLLTKHSFFWMEALVTFCRRERIFKNLWKFMHGKNSTQLSQYRITKDTVRCTGFRCQPSKRTPSQSAKIDIFSRKMVFSIKIAHKKHKKLNIHGDVATTQVFPIRCNSWTWFNAKMSQKAMFKKW